MDEATMEQYADWLDNLERTDPVGYEQLIATMKTQIESGAAEIPLPPQQQSDANTALFDMLGSASRAARGGDGSSSGTAEFTPRFPGNKVMEPSGLAAQHEGMYIDVQPGFVMKTREMKSGKKVFVNVCFSDSIQSFSQQKKLDDNGNEQEGIHVPLSLGAPHEVTDKSGTAALAFDVAVNTRVVDDCRADATGAFRNFVCELAIEYVDQKYKVKLEPRYKLPRLAYCGPLPPPQHYIRKTQTPVIQEVASARAAAAAPAHSATASTASVRTAAASSKTAVARCEIHEVERVSGARTLCTRIAAAEKHGGTALSPQVLARAGDALDVSMHFDAPVRTADDVELELRPELLCVKARGHQDLNVFLPYPVVVDSVHATLSRPQNCLRLRFTIDKTWDVNCADAGSAPWLLAQALASDADANQDSDPAADSASTPTPAEPPSLAEMFHLELAATSERTGGAGAAASRREPVKWDPVDEDEELPEDRFHRKDMMSMHILEQRRAERAQKAQEADAKRRAQRAEVRAKQQRAAAAGKTWREMYPNEPETTYIDMDDVLAQQSARRDAATNAATAADSCASKCAQAELQATDDARRAAAAWSESQAHTALNLRSALAFELLD